MRNHSIDYKVMCYTL